MQGNGGRQQFVGPLHHQFRRMKEAGGARRLAGPAQRRAGHPRPTGHHAGLPSCTIRSTMPTSAVLIRLPAACSYWSTQHQRHQRQRRAFAGSALTDGDIVGVGSTSAVEAAARRNILNGSLRCSPFFARKVVGCGARCAALGVYSGAVPELRPTRRSSARPPRSHRRRTLVRSGVPTKRSCRAR